MCLAIYKPAGTEVPLKHLENGFENHSDGAGMAWAVDGVLHVRKGMFKISEVLEQYEQIKEYPALIHFRKATHGKVDAANCHPFLFNDNKLALIHNGVLPIKCNIEGLSDTAHFVKLVLEPLVKIRRVPINDGSLNYLICTSIGTDKIAIMDEQGKTYIFNEDKGNWDGGVWYSNTSFRYAYTSYKATPTTVNNDKWKSHPYFANRAGAGSNGTDNSFRKHWDSDAAGDEAYLEFWRKSAAAAVADKSKTQRIPLLLENARDGVDDAGNVTTVEEVPADDETPTTTINGRKVEITPGTMLEYGWFDEEVEADIAAYQVNLGLNREEAIIRCFNER